MARAYAKPKKKKVTAAPKAKNPLDALYNRLVGQTKTQAQLEAEAQRLAGSQMTSGSSSCAQRARACARTRSAVAAC